MSDQIKIPCLFMRGGTSRGPYFLKSDLPSDIEQRDKILLAAMGSPDIRQIDGLGGADPVKSKVAIISKSEEVLPPDIDIVITEDRTQFSVLLIREIVGNTLTALILVVINLLEALLFINFFFNFSFIIAKLFLV